MRLLALVFMVLLSAAAAAGAIVGAESAQQQQLRQAASGSGQAFAIPADDRLADPDAVYAALNRAAVDAGVNVFRTVVDYAADGRQEVTHYVLITGPTRLFDSLSLDSGRWLTAEDSSHPGVFLSTDSSSSSAQVGVIRDLGGNSHTSFRALRSVFDLAPTAGAYTVEATGSGTAAEFLDALAVEASRAAGSPGLFTAKTFQPAMGAIATSGGVGPVLDAAQYMLVVAAAFAIAFGVLREAKRAGVMKLLGAGPIRVWWALYGRMTAVTMAACIGLAVVASLLVRDSDAALAQSSGLAVVRVCAVMMGASAVACAYVVRAKTAEAVKNRKDTRAVFAVNNLLKATASTVLIVTAASVSVQFASVSAERQHLGNWERARGYGVFLPLSSGYDMADQMAGADGMRHALTADLYPILNRDGALYVDASSFQPIPMGAPTPPPEVIQTMVVNPNYLAAFPVLDAKGDRIQVSEGTSDWIVLAPSRDRGRESEIRSYLGLVRQDPERPQGRPIDIIWTQDGQQVFSFDPAINPDQGSNVTDPVIEVMTIANSLPLDRGNMVTGDPGGAVKVRLGDGGGPATLKGLMPDLERLNLDDNLRRLVTLDQVAAERIASLDLQIQVMAIALAGMVGALLLLAAQAMSILFQHYSRRITVRRLQGYGLVRSSREIWAIFGVMWLVQVAAASVVNYFAADPSGASASASGVVVLGVAGGVAAVEAVFSVAVLRSITRRRAVRVLKEEF